MIHELFEGHTLMYLQCVNVGYKSQRRVSYMDLQLEVKGCKDVYASFDKYTEVEMMVRGCGCCLEQLIRCLLQQPWLQHRSMLLGSLVAFHAMQQLA